jgi:hypothetical protein
MSPGLLKIPPFQDAHIHFMVSGRPVEPSEFPALAKAYLFRGILSVQDMGHKNGRGPEYKKNSGNLFPFLTIRSAGLALYRKGTYGGFLGLGVEKGADIKAAVKALSERGADYLKIINSGIVSLQEKKPVTEGGFSAEQWRILQGEAEKYQLKIHCHANSDGAIRQAVDFGAASIEHGFFISRETLTQMAEKRVAWTPTLSALQNLRPFVSPEAQGTLDRIAEAHLEAIGFAATQGVLLRVGTDSGAKGTQTGTPFFTELQLFKKAGLSLKQILAAACREPEGTGQETYLLVKENFIESGRVEQVIFQGTEITPEKPGEERRAGRF